MNEIPLYWYIARLVRIIDGDTIVVDVDLGMHTWKHKVTLRIKDIDTPEPRGDTKVAGVAATDFAKQLFEEKAATLCIHSTKEDSFGRWIAEVRFQDGDNFGEVMLKTGHAVPYKK